MHTQEEATAMTAECSSEGDASAAGSVVEGASFGDVMAVNGELRGDAGDAKLHMRHSPQEDCYRDGLVVPPQVHVGRATATAAAAATDTDGGDGVAENSELLSSDALLFMLEEDEEELLFLDGVDEESIDLVDLELSNHSESANDSIEEEEDEGQPGKRGNTVPTSSETSPSSRIEERSQTSLAKASKTKHRQVPRIRQLWTMQPVVLPLVCIPAITDDSTLTTEPKPVAKTGRKRVKDELEYLRQDVSDLEEQLCQLKPQQSDRSHSQSTRDDQVVVDDSLSPMPSPQLSSGSLSSTLWKRVASRQQDGRRKAETENSRLRDLLEAQLRLTRSLARMLRKRPNLAGVGPTQTESALNWRQLNLHGDATMSAIFAHLEETVGPLYACVDAVLQETGFSTTPSKREIRDSRVKMDTSGCLFLEIVDSMIVPFDLETTNAGYWKFYSHASMEHQHRLCSLKAMDVTSDALRAQFTVSLPVQHIEAMVHGHMLGKQFTEEKRVVGVWRSVGELKSALFGDDRITLRETGWTVIEELPSTETAGSPSTIVQMVMRVTPEVGGEQMNGSYVSENQSRHVGVLTDLVLGSFQQNVDSMHQLIENMIMAEMVRA